MNKDSLPNDKKKFIDLPYQDRPDMLNSENISIYDLHEDMHTVDAIALEAQTEDLEKESYDDKYNGKWTT